MRRTPAPSCFSWQDPSLQQPGQLLPTRLHIVVGVQQTPVLGKQPITKRTVFTELQLASVGYVCRESPKTAGNNELRVPQSLPGKT